MPENEEISPEIKEEAPQDTNEETVSADTAEEVAPVNEPVQEVAEDGSPDDKEAEGSGVAEELSNDDPTVSKEFRKVYEDTVYFIDGIVQTYDVFPAILQTMREGSANVELKRRYALRAIDETWVNVVEDSLAALDYVIRHPSKYIEEREEVLPIELSRNITSKSLQHLSQHTNYISRIEGDMITPSKIMNVFKEETLMTYENKFVNTLINRLFIFVNRRYEIAKSSGQQEKITTMNFSQEFTHGKANGKINFTIELNENPDDDDNIEVDSHANQTGDLWRRVQKLNSICTEYASSSFVKEMGKTFIHPPVMRTNAILKNKNLRQCLALWQFIESYEGVGYSMMVQEDLEKVDDEYIKELYSTLALQYLIFRYNIKDEFNTDAPLDSKITDAPLTPKIISEIGEIKGDADITISDEYMPEVNRNPERRIPIPSTTRYGILTPDDKLILEAMDISLDAAEIVRDSEIEEEFAKADIPEPEADNPFIPEEITENTDDGKAASEEEVAAPAEEEKKPSRVHMSHHRPKEVAHTKKVVRRGNQRMRYGYR